MSFDHTLGGGDNRVVVVGIAAEDESASNLNINYVTYNGVNMTHVSGSTVIVGTTMLQRTDLYYILENQLPPAGTYNVYVKRAGSCNESGAGAISLFNVAQAPPEAVTTNSNTGSNSISTSITTVSNNACVVDVVGCGESGMFFAGSEASGMLRRWLRQGGYGTTYSSSAGSTMPVAAAGIATVTWSHADDTTQTDERLAHSLAVFAPAPVEYKLGDLNRDHAVDALDVGIFCGQWLDDGYCMPDPACADLNDSGRVDLGDFALLSQNYGL